MTNVYVLAWSLSREDASAHWSQQDAMDAAQREVGANVALAWRRSPTDPDGEAYTDVPPYCSVHRLTVQEKRL